MKLVELMLVRNEDWILGMTLRAVLMWCDEVVLLDHGSSDDSLCIIDEVEREHPGRIHRLRETGEFWNEMDHRHKTLVKGREIGGTHFAIVDADEMLTANLLEVVRGHAESLEPGSVIAYRNLPVWGSFDHVRSDDCRWTKARQSFIFRDNGMAVWKPNPRGYHHHRRVPMRLTQPDLFTPFNKSDGGALHFQWADWDRLVWKHRWYKMSEVIEYPWMPVEDIDMRYSAAPRDRNPPTAKIPDHWLFPAYAKIWHYMSIRPSWYQARCIEWWKKYGEKKFRALNLWGWKGPSQ